MTTPSRSRMHDLLVGPGAVWHRVLFIVVLVLNAVVGVVWRYIAPGQQFKVFSNGGYLSLPTADYHPFEALALFVLATGAVGLVAAVAIWRVRGVRGVTSLTSLVIASALGALVAASIAGLFSSAVSPSSLADASRDVLMELAPQLTTPLALLAEPLVAALVYTFLVAWDGRPDLGRTAEIPRDPTMLRGPESAPGPGHEPDVPRVPETQESSAT